MFCNVAGAHLRPYCRWEAMHPTQLLTAAMHTVCKESKCLEDHPNRKAERSLLLSSASMMNSLGAAVASL